MLKERDFVVNQRQRPIDNRYGTDYDCNSYAQSQDYDCDMNSYAQNGYNDSYRQDNAVYGQAQPRYENNDTYGYDNRSYYGYGDYTQNYNDLSQQNQYQQNAYYNAYENRTSGINQSAYAENNYVQDFDYDNAQVKSGTKTNSKAKMLIAVYFIIVAVIASLIIANVVAFGNGNVNAEPNEVQNYNQEALNMAVLEDGSIVQLQEGTYLESYDYNVQTNWFDKLCDWIADINK